MPTRTRVLLLSVLMLAGCAPSANDSRSRLDRAGPLSGEYTVRYLSPPWNLVDVIGTMTQLRIISTAEMSGIVDGGPGKYELVATVERGEPSALAANELAAAMGRGHVIVDGPRLVMNEQGMFGTEVLTRNMAMRARSFRTAFFSLPDPSFSVRLAFESTPDLDTIEIETMVFETTIGPEL